MTTLKHGILWIILLAVTGACTGHPAVPAAEDLSRYSQAEIVTLQSLEKVDDYPLYVMHYSGGYDYPRTGQRWPAQLDFACSLFAALAPGGNLLYGRNFDWDFSPALLLFTDPPDGYASVSMVDLAFLDIDPEDAGALEEQPLAQRAALLSAPSLPFDGMNEYGLAIAMAAVPDASPSDAVAGSSKPTIGSIGIIRQSLDHARSVEEAVAFFEQYDIDFNDGPPLHYLIADASGKAVLVEFYQGKMVVLPNEAPWHLATNHFRCAAEGDGGCPRYHTLSERLTAANGSLDENAALRLLSEVAQQSTQWSVAYNITTGDVSVVIGQSYGTVYPFHLDRVKP